MPWCSGIDQLTGRRCPSARAYAASCPPRRGPSGRALRSITAEWGRAAPNWAMAMDQFAILHRDRFTRPQAIGPAAKAQDIPWRLGSVRMSHMSPSRLDQSRNETHSQLYLGPDARMPLFRRRKSWERILQTWERVSFAQKRRVVNDSHLRIPLRWHNIPLTHGMRTSFTRNRQEG